MKPKNHAEATRNYLEYELEEKYLNINRLIQKRKTDLLQGYEAKQMNMRQFDTSADLISTTQKTWHLSFLVISLFKS